MTNSIKKQNQNNPHDVFTVLYQVVCVLCQSQKEEREKQVHVMEYQQWFFLCKQMIYSKAYTALCLLVYSLILCFAFITCESKLRGKSSKLGRWRGGCLRLEKTLARPA